MEEDLSLIGASAEDTEAELIRKICETELLAGMKTSLFLLRPSSQTALWMIKLISPSCSSPRGELVVCVPSSAGESLQLSRTLCPPAAHHRCLSGSLSVHDDKVKHYLFPRCITTRFAALVIVLWVRFWGFFLIKNVSINQINLGLFIFNIGVLPILLFFFFCFSPAACEENIRLMFTVLERSALPVVRANAIIALGDLIVRFPNILEPWTQNLYAR